MSSRPFDVNRSPYFYREDLSYADVAFEARGRTLEELFLHASEAMMRIMIANPESIEPRVGKPLSLFHALRGNSANFDAPSELLSELLLDFLEAFLFWKDSERLFLKTQSLRIERTHPPEGYRLEALLKGEEIDPKRHELGSDVKAVTYHRLKVWREEDRWKAMVVVDT